MLMAIQKRQFAKRLVCKNFAFTVLDFYFQGCILGAIDRGSSETRRASPPFQGGERGVEEGFGNTIKSTPRRGTPCARKNSRRNPGSGININLTFNDI